MSVEIRVGDCLDVLRTLDAESVQCVVTSPPYFGLRSYGIGTENGEIGLESTPDEYVAKLVAVFREVRRVLRPDGTVFLNLGDSYASQGGQRAYGSYDGATGRGPAPSQRVAPYGTSGRGPEGSRASDCLCGSLCDACRAAYRLGRVHNGSLPAPTLAASPFASSHGSTESESVRPPTSDSCRPVARTATATQDLPPAPVRGLELPHVVLGSTTPESARPLLDSRSAASSQDAVCRLCARSFSRSDRAFADTSASPSLIRSPSDATRDRGASTLGIALTDGASAENTPDTVCDCLAYSNLATESRRLKPKDLLGIPWRVAFALQADGWYLRSDIIWAKPNPMPESVTDRPTKSHEYLFLLSKNPTYYYDHEAIKEPVAPSQVGRVREDVIGGASHVERGQHSKGGVYKSGNTERVYGANRGRPDSHLAGSVPWEDDGAGRNKRSVWTVTTSPFAEAHFATFPPALIEPCILAGSSPKACEQCGAPWERVLERTPEVLSSAPSSSRSHREATQSLGGVLHTARIAPPRDATNRAVTVAWQPTCECEGNTGSARCTVLDPFGGAGTSGLVADRLSRNALLIELNPAYAEMARRRITNDAPLFADVREVV